MCRHGDIIWIVYFPQRKWGNGPRLVMGRHNACACSVCPLSRSLNLSISIYPSFLLLYLSFQCLGLFVCCDSPTLAVQFILSEWIGELLIQTWPPAPLRGWIIFLNKTRSCAHYVSGSFHRRPGGRKKMRVAPGSESARADGSCGAVRWSAPLDLYALCGSLPRPACLLH